MSNIKRHEGIDDYIRDLPLITRCKLRWYWGPRLSLGLLLWRLTRGRIHVFGVVRWDEADVHYCCGEDVNREALGQ